MMQKQLLWCEKNRTILIAIFFINLLCIGLAVYDDYGISCDEIGERGKGIVSFNYIFHNDRYLFKFIDRDYGVAFYVPMVLLEKVLGLKDLRDIFLIRHLMTFLVFYGGVILFYFLSKRIFNNWKYGLLGSLFLVVSPRIFADSFYNCKDSVFMSGFIAGMYTLILFLEKTTFRHAVLHGFVSGIVINIRILGILIPCFTFAGFLFDFYLHKRSIFTIKKQAMMFLLYISVFIIFAVAFWPLLWENPFGNFLETYKLILSRFKWQTTVLYLGKHIQSNMLPWHYLPVWFLISTPIIYLVLFGIGCGGLGKNIFALLRHHQPTFSIHHCVILLWFFTPLSAVIGIRSVAYDGLRHMFFLYPALLLIALAGLAYLWQLPWNISPSAKKVFRIFIVSFLVLNFISTLSFMVFFHPFQNVYFNVLAGRDGESIQKQFDLDYWGLSYRQGLEYIARSDSRQEIKIFFLPWVGMYNIYMLPLADRKRIVQTENRDEADYLIGNFRWPDWQKEYPPEDKEVYSIKVSGIKILAVYRLK